MARDAASGVFRLEEATVADINAAFDASSLTCQQLVKLYLNRIAAYEDGGPKLNSITTVRAAIGASDHTCTPVNRSKGTFPVAS